MKITKISYKRDDTYFDEEGNEDFRETITLEVYLDEKDNPREVVSQLKKIAEEKE